MVDHVFGQRATLAAAVLCACVGTTDLAAAQQGSVAVRVVDAVSGAPVDQAQVFVVGTTTGGLTNVEGRYLFRVLPAGVRLIRVLRVGYAEQKKQLEVHSGQQTELEFRLQQLALNLLPSREACSREANHPYRSPMETTCGCCPQVSGRRSTNH